MVRPSHHHTSRAEAPIIALDGENAFVAIRYNHRSFKAIRASAGERDKAGGGRIAS